MHHPATPQGPSAATASSPASADPNPAESRAGTTRPRRRQRRAHGTETLDQAQLDLLRRSRARVENRADELTEHFYEALFEHAPGLRTLFPLDPYGRRAPLADTLIWLLHRLDQRRELTERLADLGRDHRKYGITAAHYEAGGQALLAALAHIHGPSWTPSLAHA